MKMSLSCVEEEMNNPATINECLCALLKNLQEGGYLQLSLESGVISKFKNKMNGKDYVSFDFEFSDLKQGELNETNS